MTRPYIRRNPNYDPADRASKKAVTQAQCIYHCRSYDAESSALSGEIIFTEGQCKRYSYGQHDLCIVHLRWKLWNYKWRECELCFSKIDAPFKAHLLYPDTHAKSLEMMHILCHKCHGLYEREAKKSPRFGRPTHLANRWGQDFDKLQDIFNEADRLLQQHARNVLYDTGRDLDALTAKRYRVRKVRELASKFGLATINLEARCDQCGALACEGGLYYHTDADDCFRLCWLCHMKWNKVSVKHQYARGFLSRLKLAISRVKEAREYLVPVTIEDDALMLALLARLQPSGKQGVSYRKELRHREREILTKYLYAGVCPSCKQVVQKLGHKDGWSIDWEGDSCVCEACSKGNKYHEFWYTMPWVRELSE